MTKQEAIKAGLFKEEPEKRNFLPIKKHPKKPKKTPPLDALLKKAHKLIDRILDNKDTAP